MSYYSTCPKPCQTMRFRSPPSRMKATSRCTTYPRMSMIQRQKRDKSTGDQTALQVYFLLFSRKFPMMISVKRIVFLPIPLVCQQRSVRRTIYQKCSMIQQWIPEIWPLEHYWFLQNLQLSLSIRIFSIVSHLFFFKWWPLCSFISTFSCNYNFIPRLSLYVFYFIFHINYLVYFCSNRQSLPNSDWDEIFNQGMKTY